MSPQHDHQPPRPEILVPKALLQSIQSHAAAEYPNECSGLLTGTSRPPRVLKLWALPNVHEENRQRRYRIDPGEYLRVQREARAGGLEVIGIYHSHPDAPPCPSDHDLELAWPEYIYLIVTVSRDGAGPVRAWRLQEKGTAFSEVQLKAIP